MCIEYPRAERKSEKGWTKDKEKVGDGGGGGRGSEGGGREGGVNLH